MAQQPETGHLRLPYPDTLPIAIYIKTENKKAAKQFLRLFSTRITGECREASFRPSHGLDQLGAVSKAQLPAGCQIPAWTERDTRSETS